MTKIDSPFEFIGRKLFLDLLHLETTTASELGRETMFPDQRPVVRIGLEGHCENLDDAHGNLNKAPTSALGLIFKPTRLSA